MTCASGDRLRVDVALEHAASDTFAEKGVRLVAGSDVRLLAPRRHMTLGRNKTEYDISTADVLPAFFIAAKDSINVSAVRRLGVGGAKLRPAQGHR